MGDKSAKYLELPPEQDTDDQITGLPKSELYKIWLDLNGYPRLKEGSARHAYWRTPFHKFFVALDLSFYVLLAPLLLAIISRSNFAFVCLGAIVGLALFIRTRLPNVQPYGIAGACSLFSHIRGYSEIERNLQPPSINDVNLSSLAVMERAAQKIIAPTLKDLEDAIKKLNHQAIAINTDRSSLLELKNRIQREIKNYDQNWKAILVPKLEKIESRIANDDDQLVAIGQLRSQLTEKRDILEQELGHLTSRKEIFDKLATLEETEPADQPIDEAFQVVIHNLFENAEEAHQRLNQATNIAIAHEDAKLEIAELLES